MTPHDSEPQDPGPAAEAPAAEVAAAETFPIQADISGRPLEDLWSGKADEPDVWKLLEDAVHDGRPFRRVLADRPFGDPLDRPKQFSARRLAGDSDAALTLLMIEDEGKAGAK